MLLFTVARFQTFKAAYPPSAFSPGCNCTDGAGVKNLRSVLLTLHITHKNFAKISLRLNQWRNLLYWWNYKPYFWQEARQTFRRRWLQLVTTVVNADNWRHVELHTFALSSLIFRSACGHIQVLIAKKSLFFWAIRFKIFSCLNTSPHVACYISIPYVRWSIRTFP